MHPLPDLDSLRCFERAATLPSFRAAAEAVHLSPTAFSERIRALEERLETRLFERTTRRVRLTAAGARLLPQARRVLEEARRCAEVASGESAATVPFALTLGTRFELGMSWLVPSLRALERARPERTIHLDFGDSPDLVARARRGAVDALITSAPLSGSGLAWVALHEEEYVFVGSAQLLAARPIRSPKDAAEHDLIDADLGLALFRYFRDACPAGESWSFRRVVHLGAIDAIRYRVLEGAGVAVLPRYHVALDLERRRLTRIRREIELRRDHFRLVWAERHPLEAELRRLAVELLAIPLR
jgi:DNA-binding transcriptional LysR family regulator